MGLLYWDRWEVTQQSRISPETCLPEPQATTVFSVIKFTLNSHQSKHFLRGREQRKSHRVRTVLKESQKQCIQLPGLQTFVVPVSFSLSSMTTYIQTHMYYNHIYAYIYIRHLYKHTHTQICIRQRTSQSSKYCSHREYRYPENRERHYFSGILDGKWFLCWPGSPETCNMKPRVPAFILSMCRNLLKWFCR